MESLPEWAPEDTDVSTASVARVYDYFLGGEHHFAVDRELAHQVLRVLPDAPRQAQVNRAFLHRAVRFLVAQGVRQFVDIGSGIPTNGNTHETAQQAAADARVLYVDHDPVAVAHSELLLRDVPGTAVLRADLLRPKDVLESAEFAGLIDRSQPVALIMVAVLHFVSDEDDPQAAIDQFRDAVAPGSYLVVTHVSDELRRGDVQEARKLYVAANDQSTFRSREQVRELMAGWTPVEPGVVWVSQWRPEGPAEVVPDPAGEVLVVGLGRKT